MNPNLTEISKATQWKPGQSGNLNGRPVGTRQAFSAGFHRDLAEVWAKHGRAAMEKTAQDQPSVFFATCAHLSRRRHGLHGHQRRHRGYELMFQVVERGATPGRPKISADVERRIPEPITGWGWRNRKCGHR